MQPSTPQPESQPSVREFGSTRLALRRDLILTPHTSQGQPFYVLEDPLNSRFFRLGAAEYTFISLLDGEITTETAYRLLSSALPHHRLSEYDIAGFCRWLIEMDLAQTGDKKPASSLEKPGSAGSAQAPRSKFDPLVIRWPLFSADRPLARVTATFGWLFSPLATAAWLLLVATAAYEIGSQWDRFVASSRGIFAPANWWWLLACWMILKVLHEIAHGVVCQRNGGVVREAGLLFVLLAPLAYVDVTSSWRFRSSRQRIHVAAAGMYLELLIASIAALVWSTETGEWLSNLCFNTIVMASVSTILFNANPLMKFDGYFMLSDLLEMPNLYLNGQMYLRSWAKRYLFGVRSLLPNWSRREMWLIRAYAWSSFSWRVFVSISLLVTAATLFHGAGIVLAALAFLTFIAVPAVQLLKYLIGGKPGEQPQLARFAAIVGGAVSLGVIVFGWIPWPGARYAPAVVEFAPYTVIRAGSPGFVREIHVMGGQTVAPGELLVSLENGDLTREQRDLELQIQQSEIRGQRFEQRGEIAALQAEIKNREALATQLAEKRAEVEQLIIRAPFAGTVIHRNLGAMLGTYVAQGADLLSLGDQSCKEIRASVAQDDLEGFARRSKAPIGIDFPGLSLWRAPLDRVIPRASRTIAEPALSAVNGGALAVRTVDDDSPSHARSYELLTPCFTAIVRLSQAESERLYSGQTGWLVFRPCHESIGKHVHQVFAVWLRERLNQE